MWQLRLTDSPVSVRNIAMPFTAFSFCSVPTKTILELFDFALSTCVVWQVDLFLSLCVPGDEALSQYGLQFLQTVSQIKSQLEQKRDTMIRDLDEIKQSHEEALAEVRATFPAEPKTPSRAAQSPIGSQPVERVNTEEIEKPAQDSPGSSPSHSAGSARKASTPDCSCGISNGAPRVPPIKGIVSARGKGPRASSPASPMASPHISGAARRLKPPSGSTPPLKGIPSSNTPNSRPSERRTSEGAAKPVSTPATRPSSLPRRSLSIPRLQLKPITKKRTEEAPPTTDSPRDSPTPEKSGSDD